MKKAKGECCTSYIVSSERKNGLITSIKKNIPLICAGLPKQNGGYYRHTLQNFQKD